MKNKLMLVMAAVMALSVVGFAGQAMSGQAKPAKVKSDKVKGSKPKGGMALPGEAKFMKDKSGMANPKTGSKGKSKGAAAATYLHVDNRTDFNINIYVDDEFVGSVGSWGDSYGWMRSGARKLYAVSAGGTTTWGPRWYTFVDGATFTWTLE